MPISISGYSRCALCSDVHSSVFANTFLWYYVYFRNLTGAAVPSGVISIRRGSIFTRGPDENGVQNIFFNS